VNGSADFERVGIAISDAARRSLAWLAGFELGRELATARDEVISGQRDADRCRRQLIDLCAGAGIDPGTDPHAALLAHLRGPGPGGGGR